MSVIVKYIILFIYFVIFHSTFVSAIESLSTNVDIENNLTEDDNIIETQYAVCKISTEELVANARATVTKVLTGACNAKNIEEKFKKLEKHLSEELQEIKVLLRTLMKERDTFSKINDHTIPRNNELNVKSDNRLFSNNHKLSPRQYEINEFNNTITTNESSKVFTYYWEVRDFNEKLSKWDRTRSERSSTFYVGQPGYAMYLKIVPKYFPDGTIFISVSLTRGFYDSYVKWPFYYKIQLSILDQSLGEWQEDRPSRIWDPSELCTEYFWKRPAPIGEPDNPECVGLSIPRNIILSKLSFPFPTTTSQYRYIWNDSILIKLLIYL
ncbi:PREDICTED: TNF receptor-associated factor 6-like [Polistes dominula]|uniref:TNF receptor-associated factor 6-like n=1 Tax=Polistes dominula TaxID=743375 RepID=A0ABM1ITH0_POLDO|nr:PREDICTED: TNF receptor-associated factor 6-like [Polistes dominula]